MFQRSSNLLFALVFAGPIYAHEFWISPVGFEVDVQSPIAAHFRVGQDFKGGSHSYLSRYTTRHELHQGGAILEMSPREGDRPAMQHPGLEDGLAILVHETTDSTLTYREFDKFVNFIKHKDFEGLPEAHLARGLPEVGFVESYRRFAKSLIAVGSGAGQDRPVGLEIEIVALSNPYTDDLSEGMAVQVLLNAAPRADVQVEVFSRPAGTKEPAGIQLYRTDADGIARFPVRTGHDYMIDNVALRPVEPTNTDDPVWHSLWANLTFAVPAD
ncbi:MAG: DUF4198 domain-containing protein [Planktomarina temperata]|nr:DUF4198 domain-containing protein [Planktomarina temperata]